MRSRLLTLALSLVGLVAAAVAVDACADDHGAVGGAVVGPVDDHCGATRNPTSAAACTAPADAGAPEAGDAALDGPQKHEEHPLPPADAGVLFNQSGSDEDCKYDFSWTATPISLNANVTFTVTVKNRADGKPAIGADPQPEVFLDATHAAPSSGSKTVARGDGVFDVGPIRFDRAGYWTVRFHVFDACVYGPLSPHSHAAFYVNVP